MADFLSDAWTALLRLPILDGALPVTVYGLAVASLAMILLWRPTRRALVTALAAAVLGALAAVVLWLVCVRWLDLFGGGLGHPTYLWLAATLAAAGVGVAALFRRGALLKATAAVSVVAVLAAGTLAVNAVFGVNRTVGNLLNIVVEEPLPLPPTAADDADDATTRQALSLWKTWKPPAGLPAKGRTGTVSIPNAVSGFAARSAGVYLPPAALTAGAPKLPVVLMLMGHPGNPDPAPIAQVLDAYAAGHQGLAPIVLVADQLGVDVRDTGCVDSRLGKVRTYLTQDVVPWMRSHLNVQQDPRLWTVAGYSNGGQCAISLGTEHPELFREVISVSAEEFPGAGNPADALTRLFDGDTVRFEQAKPLNMLAQGRHQGTTAIFTAAKDDPHYLLVARKLAAGATNAGMATHLRELDQGGHGGQALLGGLQAAFAVAYPILGLSEPGKEAAPAHSAAR